MHTKIVEVTNGFNYGKFLLGRMDTEWKARTGLDPESTGPLLRQLGWDRRHLWVLDLQTGEGGCFLPGGSASADLNSHKVWVCPMFEPFLTWLYKQDLNDLDALPALLELTEQDAPSALHGYRRPGQ